jgi:hypothetical protein
MAGKLQINLGDLGPAFEPQKVNPLDELMARAMESERGIAIEFAEPKAAVRFRHKIYKRRRVLQDAGQSHFDRIIVVLEGSRCLLQREPEFKVIEL